MISISSVEKLGERGGKSLPEKANIRERNCTHILRLPPGATVTLTNRRVYCNRFSAWWAHRQRLSSIGLPPSNLHRRIPQQSNPSSSLIHLLLYPLIVCCSMWPSSLESILTSSALGDLLLLLRLNLGGLFSLSAFTSPRALENSCTHLRLDFTCTSEGTVNLTHFATFVG